jgi:hypothetical protein
VARPRAPGAELAGSAARAVEQAALRLAVLDTAPDDRVLALLDEAHRALRSLALATRTDGGTPSQVSRTVVPLQRPEAQWTDVRSATTAM